MTTTRTLAAAAIALGLFGSAASARTIFDQIRDTAPRSDVFQDIRNTAPRSVFDDIRNTAPRSVFDDIRDTAPKSADVFGDLGSRAP